MVKKRVKRAAALALAVAMTMGALPAGVKAEHTNPKTGGQCNNTYVSYDCLSYITSMSQGSHVISGGIACFITGLVFNHKISCSSCGAYLSRNSYACTVEHSKCGSRIVNHPGY